MSAQPIKKKRFEGLIQFQDPLRQALVCLQAALTERFTTAAQLEFLRARDTADHSHFLLTSDGSEVGPMLGGLEPRHILMRVEQLDKQLPAWQQADLDNKIAAWIDSSDPLTAQYFFQMLAHAIAGDPIFDLARISAWGAAVESIAPAKKTIFKQPWMNDERTDLIETFKTDALPLFSKIEKQTLGTDGCSVSFMLEGPTSLSLAEITAGALKQLAKPGRHLVVVHYKSGPKPTLQCAYLTPMRLPLKDLQSSTLKGFLLLHDIKETAKLSKSVLAS